MHARTREILEYLDGHRATLEAAVAEVPSALRERRPAPEQWSVAEVLEHLAVVEQRVLRVLEEHLSPASIQALPSEQETDAVAPMLDLSRVLDRSKPLIASEASQPREGLSASQAWAALTERRRQLRERVLAAEGRALGSVVIPHPRLGTLNLYQWLLFLGGHEARHAAQIRETALTLGADAPSPSQHEV